MEGFVLVQAWDDDSKQSVGSAIGDITKVCSFVFMFVCLIFRSAQRRAFSVHWRRLDSRFVVVVVVVVVVAVVVVAVVLTVSVFVLCFVLTIA
jgi:hypothetical protein